MVSIHETLAHLAAGRALSAEQAEDVFSQLLDARLDDAQIGALLALIAVRSPAIEELVGAARALRRRATAVEAPPGMRLLDTCGTGGAPKTFNISTISAVVIASAGGGKVGVAKHGNRSRSGRGSAEVLEALGVNIHAPPATQARSLRETGVCFSFAPDHHGAVRHASTARKSLGFPTIFNLVGPLANPAGARRQVIGTWTESNAERIAGAAARLGTEHALVVFGRDGMDELTTTSTNCVFAVREGRVQRSEFDAATIGMPRAEAGALAATSLEDAVRIFREVIGGAPGPRTDIVLLNAGAGLHVSGLAADIGAGVALAREAVQRGEALRTLDGLIAISRA